ncbi:hypothetical protein P9112_000244 [Eukaryota sp. TZLM1-RC]
MKSLSLHHDVSLLGFPEDSLDADIDLMTTNIDHLCLNPGTSLFELLVVNKSFQLNLLHLEIVEWSSESLNGLEEFRQVKTLSLVSCVVDDLSNVSKMPCLDVLNLYEGIYFFGHLSFRIRKLTLDFASKTRLQHVFPGLLPSLEILNLRYDTFVFLREKLACYSELMIRLIDHDTADIPLQSVLKNQPSAIIRFVDALVRNNRNDIRFFSFFFFFFIKNIEYWLKRQ